MSTRTLVAFGEQAVDSVSRTQARRGFHSVGDDERLLILFRSIMFPSECQKHITQDDVRVDTIGGYLYGTLCRYKGRCWIFREKLAGADFVHHGRGERQVEVAVIDLDTIHNHVVRFAMKEGVVWIAQSAPQLVAAKNRVADQNSAMDYVRHVEIHLPPGLEGREQLAGDPVVRRQNVRFHEVGEVAVMNVVLVEIGLRPLKVLSPLHSGVTKITVRLGWTSPELIAVRHVVRKGVQARDDIPDQQARNRIDETTSLFEKRDGADRRKGQQERHYRQDVPNPDVQR